MQTRAQAEELTGIPASWLIESLISVQSFEERTLAIAAKFGAVELASRQLNATMMLSACHGCREPAIRVGAKIDPWRATRS